MNEQEAKKFAKEIGREFSESFRSRSKWTAREKVSAVVATLAACVAIYLGLFHGLQYVISSEMKTALEPVISRLDKFEPRLDGMEKRTDRIEARAIPAMLSAPFPKDSKQLEGALDDRRKILDIAAERKIEVSDIKSVTTSGMKVIDLAKSNMAVSPLAWLTALAYLKYRSVLNTQLAPPIPGVPQSLADKTANFAAPGHADGPIPRLQAYWGTEDKHQAAVMRKIGEEDPNSQLKTVPYHLLLSDGAAVLDGQHFKNVTLSNMRIIYRGGPVILENVVFSDCMFEVQSTPNGQNFGEKLIANTQVDFATAKAASLVLTTRKQFC